MIGLGAGEPDFDTPEHIKEAAIRAIRDGQTKYTAVEGTLAVRQGRGGQVQARQRPRLHADQVLVSSGGKQSFFNLCQAVVNPGDEVVVPAPYWVSYPEIVAIAGGTPVTVMTTAAEGNDDKAYAADAMTAIQFVPHYTIDQNLDKEVRERLTHSAAYARVHSFLYEEGREITAGSCCPVRQCSTFRRMLQNAQKQKENASEKARSRRAGGRKRSPCAGTTHRGERSHAASAVPAADRGDA